MASVYPDIKPTGLSQKDLVNLLYMLVSSIKGICVKLDSDGGVTDENYEALCYTALFNTVIEDTRGNKTGRYSAEQNFYTISPYGKSSNAEIELAYQIYNSLETLTEKLDADGTVNDETYEANVYTAKCLKMVLNQRGDTLGNGKAFWFNPGSGLGPQREVVDWLYDLVDAIETLTEQLDADSGVTDDTYESLWFTANILMRVENSQGNTVGNNSNSWRG